MNVLNTAVKHMSWVAARQAITAGNMANADTSAFKAREIEPFGQTLAIAASRLTASNAAHVQPKSASQGDYGVRFQGNKEVSLSGNDVIMEKEMRTAGENTRLYSIDISLIKTFHRMLLSSVKG
jgi:flagellar basal-body rod protein FlgB